MKLFRKTFKKNWKTKIGFILFSVLFLLTVVISQAPQDSFAKRFDVHVSKNESISSVADKLYEKSVISSRLLFKLFSLVLSKGKGILAGDYKFNYPESTIAIAYRMVKGEQKQPKLTITIPEGTNVYDMAYIYMTRLDNFNAPLFVALAQKYEGYLFPDSYYFLANTSPEKVIKTMKENFDEKIKSIDPQIKAFNKPLKEIITMASLVEEEARADDSRKVIAGILWKRLEDGTPLQVDAPFYYITGKKGNFTFDDLKIDSPYNTYINKGLPKGPISNPGLATILDTISPKKTPYWYYLTGKDGEIRYAQTFAQHIDNKNTYLK